MNDEWQGPQLDTLEDYRRRFTDVSYWRPFVESVCQRHGLLPNDSIRQGDIPGTYPVFILQDRWVVKFFGRLFNGESAFTAELDVSNLLAHDGQIPAPSLVTYGHLIDENGEWPWPYLVFEHLAGESLASLRDRVSVDTMSRVARELGNLIKLFHALPLSEARFLGPTWDAYLAMLERQRPGCKDRHREWRSLPDHLIEQIDEFLPPTVRLVDCSTPPRLLHGDLTADHAVGQLTPNGWRIQGLIDFGDALVGDPMYELIALHLDLFQCDKRLLSAFLMSYDFEQEIDREDAAKLLSLCLLHPFNVFEGFRDRHPEAQSMRDLSQFADWLWWLEE